MSTTIIILSWIGTVLTSINLMPQVYKVLKTKDTKSIALIWLLIGLTACIVWIAFAILSSQWAILVTNILVFTTTFIIFAFKLYNIRRRNERI